MRALPQPNEPFYWVQSAAGPALVCRAIEPYASHLFTTRHWRLGASRSAVDDRGPWNDVANAINVPPAQLARVRQPHGTSVARAEEAIGSQPHADIVIGRDPAVALAVQVADCVPILIVDVRTGAVAAVHAGWRGLAAGIPRLAIGALARAFASRSSDLYVAVGPSIGACCYEVGHEVRDRFAAAGFCGDHLTRWFAARPTLSIRNPVGRHSTRPNRWFFDTWRSTVDQLISAGVPTEQVFVSELCTASHPETFCSYRRDGAPAGRMAGVIRSPLPRP